MTTPGEPYRVDADQDADRLDRKLRAVLRAAELNGSHVWTALTAFYLPDPEHPGLVLGPDNLVMYPTAGCYRCEQSYTRALQHRRCPGEPR